jgi:hypothetical protein
MGMRPELAGVGTALPSSELVAIQFAAESRHIRSVRDCAIDTIIENSHQKIPITTVDHCQSRNLMTRSRHTLAGPSRRRSVGAPESVIRLVGGK